MLTRVFLVLFFALRINAATSVMLRLSRMALPVWLKNSHW
jgi:hypothetical protein